MRTAPDDAVLCGVCKGARFNTETHRAVQPDRGRLLATRDEPHSAIHSQLGGQIARGLQR